MYENVLGHFILVWWYEEYIMKPSECFSWVKKDSLEFPSGVRHFN